MGFHSAGMTADIAEPDITYLARPDGLRLAMRRREGARGPGVMLINGLLSDMSGHKSVALDRWAARNGRSCLRYDAFAHGLSDGDIVDATITRFLDDARALFDERTTGPQILVGSSVGGWLSCLLAAERTDRVAGLVLIAPATDGLPRLVWPALKPEDRAALERGDVIMRQSSYMPPYPVKMSYFESARDHLVLDKGIAYAGPVRILQGTRDDAVPWRHALLTAEAFRSKDVTVSLVKGGDHRLSKPGDIARLLAALDDIAPS